jgi:hypothetical protein
VAILKKTPMRLAARHAPGTMLAIIVLTFGVSTAAYAEVIDSGHTVTTNVVTNPCDAADGLIVITTDTLWVTRLQPDGTVVSHFHNHSEGVSANGTKYIANRQATTTTAADSTTAQVEVEIRRISAGPGDNAVFTVTGAVPGTLTTTVRCVG